MKALSLEIPRPEPVVTAMAIIPMFSMTCESMRRTTARAAMACMLFPAATRFMTWYEIPIIATVMNRVTLCCTIICIPFCPICAVLSIVRNMR